MNRFVLILVALLFATPAPAAEMTVTVSIAPLKYFVEQIGGDRVRTEVFVPAGASPATFEPKPRQMVQLAESRLFIAVGVPFERAWLPRIANANPAISIVKATAGMKLMPMQDHHHDGGDHEGDRDILFDPHVWNAPSMCREMAGTILSALVRTDPAGSNVFQRNYDRLLDRINDVDGRIRTLLTNLSGVHFMVYHPSWGYFAREYGLIQVPVEVEGKEPGPRELAEIIRLAKKESIKVIFIQPQFSKKSAQTIAKAINGRVVIADPLAEDWGNNLVKVAGAVRDALN